MAVAHISTEPKLTAAFTTYKIIKAPVYAPPLLMGLVKTRDPTSLCALRGEPTNSDVHSIL